ncbi:substrate-binding domain-containing protein [Pseudonocardia sp. N23]|uniref:substrate-binding domain-containing protein n=1 Tax=Pseudonocardia sp. N23 TaxID=1987376 RepID=UPI000BFB5297|nr:substrate-binding domain-containing protein [Pseudonocardia sp. N23]GAY08468.1 putative nitrile hydratase regulator clustered with urea transport [Pseudonocardia sp. N23]
MSRAGRDTVDLAFVMPLQGSAGIYGASCEACATLAVEELNARSGLLGREVRLTVVDGSAPPEIVADQIDALITMGAVDAVTGWHISAVRREVARRTAHRVPYVYAPLHEGGENTPGVFMAGETPASQLVPAMQWMTSQLGARRWLLVGNDYIWPRLTGAVARLEARRAGTPLLAETYVPLGTTDFSRVLHEIEVCGADTVMMLLVGQDGVEFNRQFAEWGLVGVVERLSPHVEENMLLAGSGAANTGLFAAAGYFDGLNTTQSLEFAARYYQRFGAGAPPLNSIGESCYEAMLLLAQLVTRAGSLDVYRMITAAEGLVYEGPRGTVRMNGNQLEQSVYMAVAQELEFDIQDQLTTV